MATPTYTDNSPAQLVYLVDPSLKIINTILAKFQNSHNVWKEIHSVLWIAAEIYTNKTCTYLKLKSWKKNKLICKRTVHENLVGKMSTPTFEKVRQPLPSTSILLCGLKPCQIARKKKQTHVFLKFQWFQNSRPPVPFWNDLTLGQVSEDAYQPKYKTEISSKSNIYFYIYIYIYI